ncbi:MAG: ABC transporter ATP-binding protein [Candidatus Dadabacteria bacterium]|nr:MAG: ABC transporter ATP-binding protein [Candidatus Dadabacteria bacterium]
MNQSSSHPSPLKFIVQMSSPYRRYAISAIFLVTVASTLNRSLNYLIKLIIDAAQNTVAGSLTIYTPLSFILLYGVAIVINSLLWRGTGFTGQKWITSTEALAYRRLFKDLNRHSINFFQSRFAGSLSNKITNVTNGIHSILSQFLWQLYELVISITGTLFLLSLANVYLMLFFLLWLTGFLAAGYFQVKRLSKLSYKLAHSSSLLRGKVVDSISNVDSVQLLAGWKREQRYIGKYIELYRRRRLKQWNTLEWNLVFNGAAIDLWITGSILIGFYLLIQGAITTGDLVMVIGLTTGIYLDLFFLAVHVNEVIGHYNGVKEGLEEIYKPVDIKDSKGATSLRVKTGEIEYDDIYFSYPNGAEVFSGLNLRIAPGERVGLVGPSGVGKSTLIKLLLRLYQPQAGQIKIDGQNIAEVTLTSLRENIAVVSQDISLFHRTLLENIKCARPDANRDDVIRAAKLARADDFIKNLSLKYATVVGERGVKLSGGERQRIAIARAILRDAPIVILDEATSSLDSASEELIQEALNLLCKDRTVISIAHRLSTLRTMDRLVYLEDGRIIEEGSHRELLNKNGRYARLWNIQAGAFG